MEQPFESQGEISLLALSNILVRSRRRIAVWALVGTVAAGALVWSKPLLYQAETSFLPQGGGAGPVGIASLAGQFGISLPSTGTSLSPEFYSELLTSRVVLESVLLDTVVVEQVEGRRHAIIDLFEIEAPTPTARLEQGVSAIRGLTTVAVDNPTGIVEVAVVSRWPDVSAAILTGMLEEVERFNHRMMQHQAAAERAFLEARLANATAVLRDAEDRLQVFLSSNRQLGNSPELMFQRDRLQREVTLHQQVYGSIAQAYEEIRMQEARNTPVLTIVEPPVVPTSPRGRGRLKFILLGAMIGGAVGLMSSMVSVTVDRRRKAGDAEAIELSRQLSEMRHGLFAPVRKLSGRRPSSP